MMRAGFGRDQIAMIGQQLRFRARRNVQHVEAMLVSMGEIDRAARGDQRGGVVADARVIGDVVRAGEAGRIRADRRFIFAVGRDRQRRLGEDPFERRLFVDEQIAGAGADEDLDPRRAVGGLQLVEIVARRPDVEAIVDERLLGRQRELLFEPRLRDRRRHGVRHFEKRRDAALGARAAGRGEIFLVRQPRLAEMDLVVDHAGHQVQPGGVDHFVDAELGRGVDVGDPRTLDHDRAAIDAVGKDDSRVLDEGSHRTRRDVADGANPGRDRLRTRISVVCLTGKSRVANRQQSPQRDVAKRRQRNLGSVRGFCRAVRADLGLTWPGARRVDASGQYAFPGSIDGSRIEPNDFSH